MRNLVDADSLRRLLFAKMDRSRMQLTISAELFDDLIKMVPQMTDDMAYAQLEADLVAARKTVERQEGMLRWLFGNYAEVGIDTDDYDEWLAELASRDAEQKGK